jgi:hypothetical protein
VSSEVSSDRVEEVDADDVRRAVRHHSELHHGDRRRVRRQDGVGPLDDLVELTEDVGLQRLVLDDRLDDEVAVGEVAQLGGVRQVLRDRVVLGLADLVRLQRPVDGVLDLRLAPLDGAGIDFAHDRRHARLGAHFGDSRSHEAATNDPHPGDPVISHAGLPFP